METNNEIISLFETADVSTVSQQFGNDYVIPDYEAEVMRVICCKSYPYITGQNISGDKLTVDISVVHRVIYQSYDMTVHTTSTEETYVKTVELKPGENYTSSEVFISEEYTNCKALSKRRLDIRGSLNIMATTYTDRSYFMAQRSEENEIKYESIDANVLKFAETKSVVFRDNLQETLEQLNIIECLCSVETDDYRIVSGKLVIKGNLKYNAIYLDEMLNAQNKEFSLPFGQIIDISNADENDKCIIIPECKDVSLTPGEGQTEIETAVCFDIKCFGTFSKEIPTDGYNTKYECSCDNKEMVMTDYIKVEEKNIECSVPLGNIGGEAVKINYLSLTPQVCELEKTDGEIKVSCMLSGYIFGTDASGTAMGIDKKGEFSFNIESGEIDSEKTDIKLATRSLEYEIDENGEITAIIEIKAEYAIGVPKKYDVLENINADTENPKSKSEKCGIVVYFADGGESVFDIGKRYNVSIDDLYSGNGLTSDILVGKKKIIIPVF